MLRQNDTYGTYDNPMLIFVYENFFSFIKTIGSDND